MRIELPRYHLFPQELEIQIVNVVERVQKMSTNATFFMKTKETLPRFIALNFIEA